MSENGGSNGRISGSGRRIALITGASEGIGRSYAQHLAREGSDLILVARNAARLDALASELATEHHVSCEVLALDLTRAEDVNRLEQRIAAVPRLDLLINNAGFGTIGLFSTLDPEREVQEIALNVVALVRLTRAALPAMVARSAGAIINVSSLACFQPGPFNATYTATKAYVTSFSESLAEELRGSGIVVQVLCPGFTHTEFQERAGADFSDLPSMAWMSADEVVQSSLAALARREVVHVPGGFNRALAAVVAASPRRLLRRLTGILTRRRFGPTAPARP